ncbi:neuronal PAS domain-containing protein 2 isoform X2 [Gadus macrocephalus]|uniref:neuronal PAS domain-containing protein 2 isoform X2 n=1 Tax=Gadus macrocephalus TaxID=80720 RepID=UPI0028CB2A52|nr:neuronal PAS domain-containing protein 2 isoform X2 [Gadus macrocephalus]
MDSLSDFSGPCASSRREWDTGSCVDDLLEEDEKDRVKRASRNKSEKKRRDQFNVLIKELCTMLQVQGLPCKMDKSTILQRTIGFLQKQKDMSAQNDSCDVRQDWKPSFLSNEEFTQLMLEALDGFLVALTTDGNIIYVSDSVSSLIGHLPPDMVDQNILNFLPEREHSDVYKLLSSHMLSSDPASSDFLDSESHVEFCCHLARGNMDLKEPPVYEYVKFIGDFKFHNNVPTSSCNGLELALPRTLQSSLEEQLCLIATVRLVTPQFLKDLCNVQDPCDEFTSRHSLEWKFLFLDHRASPIIGYLPFEVLGTSGYDYYHVDDLELIAQCHKHLMQLGKGKSCCYRFLTKGQQWIWLQTHYYITYHQWNSKPEFIVCTHTVVSYAEVRAERRRAMGLEEVSPVELAPSSVKAQELYLDFCSTLDPPKERTSAPRSVSSRGSRKSSHLGLSDSASANSYTEPCTPSWQSTSIGTDNSTARLQPGGSKQQPPQEQHQQPQPQTQPPQQQPQPPQQHQQQQQQQHQHPRPPAQQVQQVQQVQQPLLYQQQLPLVAQPQLGMMNHLKEQLEERTRILQADIKTQQQELHDIKEKLQLANFQMFLQPPIHTDFGQVPTPQPQRPGRPVIRQNSGPPAKQQACHAPSANPLQVHQRLVRRGPVRTLSLPVQGSSSLGLPLYTNPMMFSSGARPLQDARHAHLDPADFSQDGQLRMLLNQPMQTLVPNNSVTPQTSQCNPGLSQTKYTVEQQLMGQSFTMQQVNCNAVLVPSPVFTSPFVIPHNSFITHQPQAAYQQPTQHAPLQLQQPQQFFQMQTQGLLHSGSTPAFLHATNIPQQSTLGYIQQQPQQQQQQQQQQQRLQQQQHSQNQPGGVSDFQNMLTR